MDRPRRSTVRIPYSEIFRLVGAYVDKAHLTEIRVLETEDGVILQGLLTEGDHAGERTTYQLTTDDIQMLWDNALAQRSNR